jgi:hypothetical protein
VTFPGIRSSQWLLAESLTRVERQRRTGEAWSRCGSVAEWNKLSFDFAELQAETQPYVPTPYWDAAE